MGSLRQTTGLRQLKITSIEFMPLRLQMRAETVTTGANVKSEDQRDLSAEQMAKVRYAPPETVLVRVKNRCRH